MSPDPYDGSMDLGNPQSLNRYSYAANNPLRYTDPSGLVILAPQPTGGGDDGDDDGEDYSDFFTEAWSWIESKLAHPKFHGSTVKRPVWDWHNLQLGQPPNIGQVLGLPGGCEFGACGGGGYGFQQGAAAAIPAAVACAVAEPCGTIAGVAAIIGMVGYDAYVIYRGGKSGVGHDYVRDRVRAQVRALGGDYCSVLKSIRDAARRSGDSKLFEDAKATYKEDCRGYRD